MKTTKQRIQQLKLKGHNSGKYLLRAIPNTEEGRKFLKDFKKYFNNDCYTFYKQGRKDYGTWMHSINQDESDSFVLYVKSKQETEAIEKQRYNSHQLLMLKQQVNLIQQKLDEFDIWKY